MTHSQPASQEPIIAGHKAGTAQQYSASAVNVHPVSLPLGSPASFASRSVPGTVGMMDAASAYTGPGTLRPGPLFPAPHEAVAPVS